MSGLHALRRTDGDGRGLEACVVRMSPDRFGGKANVERHRAYSPARTRKSGTKPQAPRRWVNS